MWSSGLVAQNHRIARRTRVHHLASLGLPVQASRLSQSSPSSSSAHSRSQVRTAQTLARKANSGSSVGAVNDTAKPLTWLSRVISPHAERSWAYIV